MREQTLLERIQALESDRPEEDDNPSEKEIRSIITHLKKLLNTNKGSVQISDDLGMPDMVVFEGGGISETAEKIEKTILEVVKKYEKRLSGIKVRIESNPEDVLNVHFRVEGVLTRRNDIPVFLETALRPGGRITITRQENTIV